jgi:ligand-binding sensor domain-containing protein
LKKRALALGRSLLGLALGAAAVVAAGLLLLVLVQRASPLRPGWRIVRPPNEVTSLALHEGAVWAAGRDGILALDRQTSAPLPALAPAQGISLVTALLVSSDGSLWVAHLEGLSRRKAGAWTTLRLPARPLSLLEDEGVLLVGTEKGLGCWRDSGFEPLVVPQELAGAGADVLCRDRHGVLWVGSASATRGGLWSLDANGWRRRDAEARLPHLSVNAIVETRDGSLWVATGFANQGGAARHAGGRWETWTRREGLAGEKVRSVFEDHAGRLWFGSEYDGVAVRSGAAWRNLTTADGLAGREVKCVLEDPDGVFWVGTDSGLTRIATLD